MASTRLQARAFGALASLALCAGAVGQSLERQLRDVLGDSKLGNAQVGVCVVDVATGDLLATINEKQSLVPASNLKLLTSGAALWTLGKDFEFRTRLLKVGDTLVISASGDPGFAEPRLLEEMNISVGTFVDRLADAVRKAGVSGLREVVIDDRVFDKQWVHPSWPEDQLNRWYAAEVSGLMFHGNLLQVFATAATRPGPSPVPRTEPSAPWLEVASAAQTVATGSTALWAVRDPAATFRYKLLGSIRTTPAEPVEVATHDSGMIFARLLADRLAAAGLMAPGAAGLPRYAGPEESLEAGEVLVVVRTPIARVLKRCNADSYNLYAEALLKRTGREVSGQGGSWANGATVVRMLASEKLGHDAGELIMADGSGLSRENRVSAHLMASWLGALARDPLTRDAFIESLASPGEGTLSKRFRDKDRLTGEVAAKSGFINGVQCLSGYVTQPDGHRAAFSILVNNTGQVAPGGSAKEFHEKVVRQIDKWMDRNKAAAKPRMGG
ncbi:MAG: D-alanyl-D-alanine carboxypeptidase/D-alanyl-D-alanine-endopeptidase [Phycisphaerales bacterium]